MTGYDFHPEAAIDLDEIWDFIAVDSLDAADNVIEEGKLLPDREVHVQNARVDVFPRNEGMRLAQKDDGLVLCLLLWVDHVERRRLLQVAH